MHELILGGVRSGKSAAASARAAAWLDHPGHRATLIATARPGDGEMARRIALHQASRAQTLPAMACLELQRDELAQALVQHAQPERLLVVDCLTLWLTQLLLPQAGLPMGAAQVQAQMLELTQVLRAAPGPVVLVSNEIGLGVTPLGVDTRRFLDALGHLHQVVAASCERVTLMVAGCEVAVKGPAR